MTARRALGKPRREALIAEAIVDAYGESEQRVGFLCMLQEHLACPFSTHVLGEPVRVVRIDFNDAEEIVAICRRQHHRQLITIINLSLTSSPTDVSEWID